MYSSLRMDYSYEIILLIFRYTLLFMIADCYQY